MATKLAAPGAAVAQGVVAVLAAAPLQMLPVSTLEPAVPAAAAVEAAVEAAVPETSGRVDEFDSSRFKLHSQGAEARVWEGTFLGQQVVVKQRFPKRYRHPTLDAKLTVARLKQEARGLLRARRLGVRTPALLHVDHEDAALYLDRVPGRSVKTTLHQGLPGGDAATEALMGEIGRTLARLHDGDLVHGDLTTSNMLVREGDGALVLIDFGLSFPSRLPEDKAVDLYVLERAFSSAHAERGTQLFECVMEAYRCSNKQWSAIFNRLADVRMRGRKRTMLG